MSLLTRRSTELRRLPRKRWCGAVALTVLVALVSGCADDDPLIPQERVSELFEDSVTTATALLGEHDVEASEAFEWHEDSWAGCEYARYARWRLTDYAAGDQVLREIARLGAEAGLRIRAWDGTEDGGHWLDEQGTASWDDNPEPHYRYIGDQYGGPIPEHHLEAQILVTGVRPMPAFSFALFGGPTVDPPKGSDWLELSVCRRENSD